MSDVQPAAPAPSSDGGVPVENPQGRPAPVENRAPEAPQPSQADKPSASIDEALRKAVDKHRTEPKDDKPPAKDKADAKAEPQRAPEKPRADPKEGADERRQAASDKAQGETVDDKPARERAPDGKFAPRPQEEGQGQDQPQQPKAATPAPNRYSPQAKAEWDATPESVRSEISRREQEVEEGFKRYRETVEPLKPYLEEAEKRGEPLHKSLERYVHFETWAQRDVVGAFTAMANELGLDISKIAAHIVGRSPEQAQADTRQSQAMAENEQLRRQLASLTQRQQSFEQEQRLTSIASSVEAFAAQHPRFDELSESIAQELHAGYTLPEAYSRAERLNPVSADAQPIRPAHTPDAQTVPARRSSITGAPSSGSSGMKPPPASSNQEALERAFAAYAR